MATRFHITIEGTGETFQCDDQTNVLEAMEAALCKGIPVGCRNGGCGACKALVVAGRYTTRKMNRAVVSEEEQVKGYVLSCKLYPEGDLLLAAADLVAKRKAGFEFSMGWQSSEPKKET